MMEDEMTTLKNLKFATLPKLVGTNPTLDRRTNIIRRLEEQKLLLANPKYTRTVKTEGVEKQQKVRAEERDELAPPQRIDPHVPPRSRTAPHPSRIGISRSEGLLTYFAVRRKTHGMSGFDAVDGSSTGTEVPWMWVLLRPPTIQRSQTCKRSRQSVSTSPSRFFKSTELTRQVM
jgi:hypothetical protein